MSSPKALLPYLLISFVTLTSISQAQKFTPGYYIKTSGDTTKTDVFLKKKGGDILELHTKTVWSSCPISFLAPELATRITW